MLLDSASVRSWESDMTPREPGSPGFWLIVGVLLFVVVPYGFLGESGPRLWHLPLWFHLSVAAAIAIAGLSAWRIVRFWDEGNDD